MTLPLDTSLVLFDLLEQLGEEHCTAIADLLLQRNVVLGMKLREALFRTIPWKADRIGRTCLEMEVGNVLPGKSRRMQHVCSYSSKIERIVIPTNIAPHFTIVSLRCENAEQLTQPIPATIFEPNQVDVGLSLNTCPPAQIISLSVNNTSEEARGFYAQVWVVSSGSFQRLAGEEVEAHPFDFQALERIVGCFVCGHVGELRCSKCLSYYCAAHINSHEDCIEAERGSAG